MNFLCLYFIFLLLSFSDAQYHLAKEENSDKKRIFEEFARVTITYCLMKCNENSTCHFIGTDTFPSTQPLVHCYLIKEKEQTVRTGITKRMFILKDVGHDTVTEYKSENECEPYEEEVKEVYTPWSSFGICSTTCGTGGSGATQKLYTSTSKK